MGFGRCVACGPGGAIFVGGFGAGAATVVVRLGAALTGRSGSAGGTSTGDGPGDGASEPGGDGAAAVGVEGDSPEAFGAGDAAVVWLG
jgi:hypothetical protein